MLVMSATSTGSMVLWMQRLSIQTRKIKGLFMIVTLKVAISFTDLPYRQERAVAGSFTKRMCLPSNLSITLSLPLTYFTYSKNWGRDGE